MKIVARSFLCCYLQTTKDPFNTQFTICLHCLVSAGRLLCCVSFFAHRSALWAFTAKGHKILCRFFCKQEAVWEQKKKMLCMPLCLHLCLPLSEGFLFTKDLHRISWPFTVQASLTLKSCDGYKKCTQNSKIIPYLNLRYKIPVPTHMGTKTEP